MTTTTTEAVFGFGQGTHLIGTDIEPGLYISFDSRCYWERLEGVSGDFGDIISNDNFSGQAVVDLKPTDTAFNSDCSWQQYRAPLEPVEAFGEGTYVVGEQIKPGVYRTDAPGSCYWQRSSGFGGEFTDIITNDNFTGSGIVEIRATDAGFTTSGDCGTWTRVE